MTLGLRGGMVCVNYSNASLQVLPKTSLAAFRGASRHMTTLTAETK
jgi:hypothetical protein